MFRQMEDAMQSQRYWEAKIQDLNDEIRRIEGKIQATGFGGEEWAKFETSTTPKIVAAFQNFYRRVGTKIAWGRRFGLRGPRAANEFKRHMSSAGRFHFLAYAGQCAGNKEL